MSTRPISAPCSPRPDYTDAQKELLALSDKLVDEVFAADIIVIGSAMINFTVTSTLKSWFDFIACGGKTFRYTAEGPEGLVDRQARRRHRSSRAASTPTAR